MLLPSLSLHDKLKTMFLILSSLLFVFQLDPSSAYLPTAQRDYCNRTYGNYTTNSTYRQNLQTVLFNMHSDTKITTGFYNFSYGEPPDTVYAIALCRADVTLADCRRCLNFTSTKLLSICSNQKQAIRWYNACMVRYNDRPMFGVMDTNPLYAVRNESKVLNPSDFNRGVLEFLEILVSKTAAGNSTIKFAMEKRNVTTNQTVYAFTQCTPDLSQSACNTCLSIALSDLPNCCLPYKGLKYFRPSCNLRYDTDIYWGTFGTLEASSPPNSGMMRTIAKIAIVVTMIVGCLLLGIYLRFRRDREGWQKADNVMDKEDDTSYYETFQIPYCDIMEATQGFAEENKIGRGGFGTVYKGMLASGKEIAVKRLARNSLQGEAEFRTEMLLVAKLQHRNLVRLLGYSSEGVERLLIYEFVPNRSLDHFLFGKTKRESLDWPIRHNIIGGIARGILYLHEDSRIRIVHRDLKASNILLDANFDPKIADFGMARLFRVDQTHSDTIRIAGTFGYMAPEYVYRGIFSDKSDVYSFGVLVLEIICGRKNSGNSESDNMEDLITIVWRNWRERTTLKVVDSALVSSSTTQIIRCIQIGLLCVQEDPVNRPTMFSINLMLNSESQSIPFPSDPGYELHRSVAVDLQFPNTTK